MTRLVTMQILIVDDDATALTVMCESAAALGFDHICLDNPQEALKHLPTASIILVDWEMPGMSGLDFIKAARVQDANIPVIMVTVKDDYESIHKAFDAGADDFMSKPINPREMAARIQEALKNKAR